MSPGDRLEIEFYGGPVGGEKRVIPYPPPPVYRVPVYAPISYTADVDGGAPWSTTWVEEHYERGRTSNGRVIYTWVDERPRLRKELAKLRAQLAAVREAVVA